MEKIEILIVDDDQASQSALCQILDSEGWHVRIAPDETEALLQLALGKWTIVIVSVAMCSLTGPLYLTLKELAQAPALESGKARLRVLFLIPELDGAHARAALEAENLPYVLKPFHFHDLLEKVSELLLETEAISEPIRRVRVETQAAKSRSGRRGLGLAAASVRPARNTGMFANREDCGMTEEEIAEYEKQESEENERKKKKKLEFSPG